MSDRWYKEGDFWRRDDGDGIYGERDDGTGDFIFNHCSKCVMDGDTSEWAVSSYFKISEYLIDRKRWPDRLNVERQAPNRIAWYLCKYFDIGSYAYRSQSDMTRDPYIAFGALYGMLLGSNDGRHDYSLEECYGAVTIPYYLYRSTTWKWRRRLINPHKGPLYVLRLRYLRAYATVKVFEHFFKIWNDE